MIKHFTFGHLHHSKEAVKLPVDVATEITAFIGRRGSGKSHGARVVVEGVLDAGQQLPYHHGGELKRASQHNAEFAEKDLARDRKLGRAERKVLLVLAHYGPRTKAFVAAHAGYSVNTGHFSNCLGSLRSQEYICDMTDGIMITAAGRTALGPVEALPSGDQLWQHWMSKLGKGEKAILQALRGYISLDKTTCAQAAGYQANTGHFSNCLGALRSLNLITGSNPIKLTDEFEEAIS